MRRVTRGAGWSGGWLQRARRCPSPNVGPRPPAERICLVLLHSISLPPGSYGGDAIERLFTNRLDWEAHPFYDTLRGLHVSAHFLVRRTGALVQFVDCDDRAWHAGESVWRNRAGCNDYSVGVELEGLEGDAFEPAQYASLVGLLVDLRRRYPIDAVVGHEHVAPGRKQDPGTGFDWCQLMAALGWPTRYFPVTVLTPGSSKD